MKKTDIAYIAGLVDGEAYIGIKKGPARSDCVNMQYHERIQIRMVDEEAISFIANLMGGNYYKEKPSCSGGRPLYCHQANDKSAAKILNILLPYLRVKKRVANKVLELRMMKKKPDRCRGANGYYRHSEKETAGRHQLYLDCKRLNKTGKEALDATTG